CVKINIKDKQIKYFIHYSGWNKNWDEWVPESRVLKYVDSNLAKQKELQKANQDHYVEGKMRGLAPSKKIAAVQQKNVDLKVKKAKQKTPGPGEGTSSGETPQGPRKKRARVDPTVESKDIDDLRRGSGLQWSLCRSMRPIDRASDRQMRVLVVVKAGGAADNRSGDLRGAKRLSRGGKAWGRSDGRSRAMSDVAGHGLR
ncbi:mortality factor 4-like protein 1, partial [Lates japonicus]